MDTSFYQYEPRTYDNEIRLLHLEPGVTDDVHFTLHPVRLSDNSFTVSLYTGLRRLRCRDAVRVLWADAVCINQNDTLEKNTQVRLMSRIYSQPSRVLIWLGEDSSDIEGLQECIDGALAVLPPENYDFETIYPISKQIFLQAYRRRVEGKPNFLSHDSRPMTRLLCRPWFDRRWIIQEVTLADDTVPRLAICGDVEFSWKDLASVAFRIGAYGIAPSIAGMSTIITHASYMISFYVQESRPFQMIAPLFMAYLLKVYRNKGSVFDCVTATSLFKCGVPHDHLYSLLSVPQIPSAIVPDYRLSVEEVCLQFAETTLIGEHNLRLLSLAPHTTYLPNAPLPARRALPSWVPDLTCQGFVHPLVSYTIQSQCFHAGGKQRPGATISADRRLLHVKGRIVDRVANMAICQADVPFPTEQEVLPRTGISARIKKRFAIWLDGCYRVAGEQYARTKARGRASGHEKETVPREDPQEETKLRRSFLEALTCGMTLMRDPISEEVFAAMQVYIDYLFDYFTEGYVVSEEVRDTILTYGALIEQSLIFGEARCFCRTLQGRLGRVRLEAKEDDVFVCIAGAEVPYLLRPSVENAGVYTLVGDSFLQGVMQGKAWLDGRYETVKIMLE
ncbi:heterokaryon incompatibility protein-domain-containing protein [Corynascus similis CBS 632.67]